MIFLLSSHVLFTSHLGDRLQRSKWPQLLLFLDNIPKSAVGKVLRIGIADRIGDCTVLDESSQISRTYEGQCPPQGAPLNSPIAIQPVSPSLALLEEYLRCQTGGGL